MTAFRALLSVAFVLAFAAPVSAQSCRPGIDCPPRTMMDACFERNDVTSPVCHAGCLYEATTPEAFMACYPDSRADADTLSAAEGDLAWQLHLKANSDFVDRDGKLYLRMNPETIALWKLIHHDATTTQHIQRSLKEKKPDPAPHGCWGSWNDPKCP